VTARLAAAAAAVGLVGTVVAANYATSRFGLVPAGFGLLVTAGTYLAGLALGLRDVVDRLGGLRYVLAAIAAGIAASFAVGAGRIAVASAVAFALSELADLAVYRPLRRRSWRRAVAASNAVGAVVDSVVFLAVAGFPLTLAAVGGQVLVKAAWCTVAVLVVAEGVRRAVRRESVEPARA
jgi:queuosine precursor transporter